MNRKSQTANLAVLAYLAGLARFEQSFHVVAAVTHLGSEGLVHAGVQLLFCHGGHFHGTWHLWHAQAGISRQGDCQAKQHQQHETDGTHRVIKPEVEVQRQTSVPAKAPYRANAGHFRSRMPN